MKTLMTRLNVHQKLALAYGATGLSAALVHNIFIIYYVHVFMSVNKLNTTAFYIGEIIYMIWNSINDPLFAYWLDYKSRWNGNDTGGIARLRQRLNVIRYGGIAWALAFLLLFLPSSVIGLPGESPFFAAIHFTLTMCIYDGCLSLVMVVHGSLLADVAISSSERATCNMYNSALSIVGSSSVFIAQLYWDVNDLTKFRYFVVIVAVLAMFGFQYTASYLRPTHVTMESLTRNEDTTLIKRPPIKLFLSQLFRQRNFWIFTAINFVQVFNCHFNSNFFSIFLTSFINTEMPQVWAQGLMIVAASILPHLFVVLLTPIVQSRSLYSVVRGLFLVKMVLALLIYFVGAADWRAICFFLVANKVFSECICRHGGLVVADIVDEDYVSNLRAESMSTMIFGVNALFTKPGQTLAPLLGWAVLQSIGFRDTSQINSIDGVQSPQQSLTGEARATIFNLLVIVPLACALVQLFMWGQFTLRGTYLRHVKKQRVDREHDLSLDP